MHMSLYLYKTAIRGRCFHLMWLIFNTPYMMHFQTDQMYVSYIKWFISIKSNLLSLYFFFPWIKLSLHSFVADIV